MSNNKSIYIAVLNQGEIKVELSRFLHNASHDSKYNIMITYPCNSPISNNRNKIVQDFLAQKEYDYLLMIDDDIIPPDNVLDLADFQKDIISPICFFFQKNMVAPLVLKRSPEGDYNIDRVNGHEGLIETDAVGTGCLLLSRKVLEDVSAPFNDIFDTDGVRKFGLDLAFCQRAKNKGYKVYCHLDYACGHKTIFDLKKIYSSLM